MSKQASAEYRIAVPVRVAGEHSALVRVRTSMLEPLRLLRFDVAEDEGLHATLDEEPFLEGQQWCARFGAAVRVVSSTQEPTRLLEIASRLRSRGGEYEWRAETADDSGLGVVMASLGVPVRMEAVSDWPSGVLRSTVDYFLHSPALQVSLEPYYSYTVWFGQSPDHPTLWDVYSEQLGVDYAVDAEGRITLAPRWQAVGRYYGTIEDPEHVWRESPLYLHLETLHLELLAGGGPCSTCPHFRFCQGYLIAADAEADCAPWRESFDYLRSGLVEAR